MCGGATPKCMAIVRKATLSCKHTMEVRCFEKDDVLVCQQPCGTLLPCGHTCLGGCDACFPAGKHPPCPEKCSKEKDCGHRCLLPCHGDKACPTECNQPCLLSCAHGPCKNLCKLVCDPCVRPYIENPTSADSVGPMICSLGNITRQPDKFEGVFDRLIAKMGRKLALFGYFILKKEQDLQQTFDPLLQSIRPNPMAQDFNKRTLTTRGNELREVINQITDFRDRVVGPIQQSIIAFAESVPEITKYSVLFHLRFDILEYRARAVLVRDTLKIAQQLMLLDDPSQGVQRQAEVLQMNAVQECLNCLGNGNASLDLCTDSIPCIKVELLLQQVQFNYLVDAAGLLTSPASGLVPSLLDMAVLLCRRYPRTAGAFLDTINLFRNHSKGGDLGLIPLVTNERSCKVERAWGQHVVGHLRTCANKHPYSSESFPLGCPECGVKVELEEEVFQKMNAHLQEDAFLKAMNVKR